jgi:hypothetical protein
MDIDDFLEPLETLRLQVEAAPSLLDCEKWQLEVLAAIAAARAGGVKSAALARYEAMLQA